MKFHELLTKNGQFAETRILQAAVRLGIFDALDTSEQTAFQVSQTLGLNNRATWILCNALTGMGLLELGSKDTEGQVTYRNSTATAAWLVRTSPTDFSGKVRFDAMLWNIWGDLEETVRTGQAARTPDMFQGDETETEHFILAMHALVTARGDGPIMARHPLIQTANTLLDIGTGPGTYPMAFCEAHPHLQTTLFDLPNTLAVTRKVTGKSAHKDRMTLVSGDYRSDPLPGGMDVVFLSNIIHGENEEMNRRLMKKIKEALNPGGSVIIKDHILDETGTQPVDGAIFSVQMLLTTTGRDYTGGEVLNWLTEVGFINPRVEQQSPPLTSTLVIAQAP